MTWKLSLTGSIWKIKTLCCLKLPPSGGNIGTKRKLFMNHILTASQFSKKDLENILGLAAVMEKQYSKKSVKKVLADKIVACMFFEPSTRTRLSFETAALKLGGGVISAENALDNSSFHKGESIEDTTRMVCNYADVLVMRHPTEGTAQAAAKVATKPVINAGDGGNQHPTQALLDLYTLKKKFGRLDNLKVAFGFDPKHSRTIRSLALLLTHYKNNHFTFICPKVLNPSQDVLKDLKKRGAKFEISDKLQNFGQYDVFYANRLQQERFADSREFEKYRKAMVITKKLVLGTKTIILDPLPRIDEIEIGVDDLPNALYFDQAKNGLFVRMALYPYALGIR
jgi:aspartate carbamoyltransferase catalytic subunit